MILPWRASMVTVNPEGGKKIAASKEVLELLLLSVLALFCELLVIRWLSTEVRIFAYFKNLPLTAAFLGLGLGFIWAQKKYDFFKLSTICFLFLSILLSFALVLKLTFLTFADPLQFLLFGFTIKGDEAQALGNSLKTVLTMLFIFVLTVFSFVGLGQRMGVLFEKMDALKAYAINIGGGLIGTILFSLLSFCYADPGVWLLFAGSFFLVLRRDALSAAIIVFGLIYTFFLGPFVAKSAYGPDYISTTWSPYYRLDLSGYRPSNGPAEGKLLGFTVYANYDGLQSILDTSNKDLASFPEDYKQACLNYHDFLFKLVPNKEASRVLVLGAGAGMDVSAGLRAGIGHIDAVEIDPAIAEMGKKVHPQKPYLSERVNLYVADARTFLKNCKQKYDAVVFAYLDSHAAFSCLSSLRMDNYVFTQEALKEAAQVLKPDGQIAIGCVLMTNWLYDRHAKALANAVGSQPIGQQAATPSKLNTASLFAGPGITPLLGKVLPSGIAPVQINENVQLASDDWPFLFLEKRQIPTLYIWPILMIVAISFLPVITQFKAGARVPSNWLMFFMGAGFMLLEVRAMADMSLLLGSTWLTNSIIIASVMLMILLATLAAGKLSSKRIPIFAACLFLSLLLTVLLPPRQMAILGSLSGICAGTAICMLPMGFAAVLFALFFKDTKKAGEALAFNLVGGVLGVFCEYSSMLLGISALGYLAAAIYAIALFIYFGGSSSAAKMSSHSAL